MSVQEKPSALRKDHPAHKKMEVINLFTMLVCNFFPPRSGSGLRAPHWIPQDCCATYLAADEAGKMNGEMAAEEGLAARYGEDGGEQLGVELGLQHHQRPVHPGPAQVGRVLSQVHLTKHRIM